MIGERCILRVYGVVIGLYRAATDKITLLWVMEKKNYTFFVKLIHDSSKHINTTRFILLFPPSSHSCFILWVRESAELVTCIMEL